MKRITLIKLIVAACAFIVAGVFLAVPLVIHYWQIVREFWS